MRQDADIVAKHDAELAGIDQLDVPIQVRERLGSRVWRAFWPKLTAIGLFLGAWQVVVLSGWKPPYVLPGPAAVFGELWRDLIAGEITSAASVTLRRAIIGFALALVIGVLIGLAVSRNQVVRTAIGAAITGLETMPSIAWFPLAILLFKISEQAILFVIVLGAAPAIANGLIVGVDHIPRLWLRAGRSIGARGWTMVRHVILPASLPSFLGGLKQGWAFAWRSLLAGELLVVISASGSLGVRLDQARQLADAKQILSTMIVIFTIGVLVDALLFGRLERSLRRRWGLLESR
jgi:NitT/TauT family transport system permease protein